MAVGYWSVIGNQGIVPLMLSAHILKLLDENSLMGKMVSNLKHGNVDRWSSIRYC